MPAYVVVDIQISDPDLYNEYKALAPAIVALYGGKYLARGGKTETLEGHWQPTRLVIIEFPAFEDATAWIDSPEYVPVKKLRHQAADSNMVVVAGV